MRVGQFRVGQLKDLSARVVPGASGHATRALFAKDVLNGVAPLLSMTYAVLANASIAQTIEAQPDAGGANVDDASIDFQINSVFSAFGLTKA